MRVALGIAETLTLVACSWLMSHLGERYGAVLLAGAALYSALTGLMRRRDK